MKNKYGKIKEGESISSLYASLSDRNKQLIKEFKENKEGTVTGKRLELICNSLVKFADLLEMDFDKADKRTITKAWNKIYSSDELKDKTKIDEYTHIRQAYRFWFEDEDDPEKMPSVVGGMKKIEIKQRLQIPKTLPTESDIHEAILKCTNARDKFWISLCAFDCGIRPVEARWLKWKDYNEKEQTLLIKTAKDSGDRADRVTKVIFSLPYLVDWIKAYPSKRSKENYIFCKLDDGKTPLEKDAISSMFRRLKRKIKYKEKFSSYILRHYFLTRMSINPNVSIPVLRTLAGHSKKSTILSEYQHIGDDEVKKMQLAVAGKLKEEDKSYILKKTAKECPRCNTPNQFDAEICSKCYFVLSQTKETETEKLRKEIAELKKVAEGSKELAEQLRKKGVI